MPCLKKDFVGQKAGHASVAVSEGMKIDEVSVKNGRNEHRWQSFLDSLFGMLQKVWNSLYQLFMVTEEGVSCSHVHSSVFAGVGTRVAV